MAISLVIADDHQLLTDMLTARFQAEPDFSILAVCRNGDEALGAAKKYRPDILTLDIRMPGKSGLAVLREMQKENLPTRVIVLTAGLNDVELTEAIRLGARGLVLKELPSKLIVQCVRFVHAGELWLEKRVASGALERLIHSESAKQELARVLTTRELQVAKLVSSGLSNSAIGRVLFISEGTVKMHVHNIYQKLNLSGRVQLSRYAKDKFLV